jgi:hypothetical protein
LRQLLLNLLLMLHQSLILIGKRLQGRLHSLQLLLQRLDLLLFRGLVSCTGRVGCAKRTQGTCQQESGSPASLTVIDTHACLRSCRGLTELCSWVTRVHRIATH